MPLQDGVSVKKFRIIAFNKLQLVITFKVIIIAFWDFQFQILSRIQIRKKIDSEKKNVHFMR